jgi:hypothetical protein
MHRLIRKLILFAKQEPLLDYHGRHTKGFDGLEGSSLARLSQRRCL